MDCDIYMIGIDDEWRSIGDTGQTPACFASHFVFLNGVLHWIADSDQNSRLICYFNIEKEQFGSFPLPSEIEKCSSYLRVVDNRLCLDNKRWHDVWKFWVLKDYGDFGSWTLEWTIEGPFTCWFNIAAKPLKMLKDGSVSMMFNGSIPNTTTDSKTTLASFNPQTRLLKEIEYGGTLLWASFADVPCFFSPMDALK